MRGKYVTHLTPLSAYVAAAPHSTASFFSPPLPPDGRASCGAGSQLCFLSRSPFMWSLPRVFPVDSETRGDVFPVRRAGRKAAPTSVIGGLTLKPSPTLWRLLAFTTCGAVAGLKMSHFDFTHLISGLHRRSKIVPLSKLLRRLLFIFCYGFFFFVERNKRFCFFQTRQCYCPSFTQN